MHRPVPKCEGCPLRSDCAAGKSGNNLIPHVPVKFTGTFFMRLSYIGLRLRSWEDTAMDENTKRMMERLKADPAALRRLMQSRDGQTLMQTLTRPDNGAGLQRAVQAAMRGDTNVRRSW